MELSPILSIQLYSLRSLGPVERQLDAAQAAGFRLVETIGSQLADPKGLKAGLDARGLMAPTGHIGIGDLRSDLARIDTHGATAMSSSSSIMTVGAM